MSLKPIPQPVLMEIVVELYLRGFEARVLLLCSGLEEEKGCQNNSCVPTVRKRATQESFLYWEVNTHVVYCNSKAHVFCLPLFYFVRQLLLLCRFCSNCTVKITEHLGTSPLCFQKGRISA